MVIMQQGKSYFSTSVLIGTLLGGIIIGFAFTIMWALLW